MDDRRKLSEEDRKTYDQILRAVIHSIKYQAYIRELVRRWSRSDTPQPQPSGPSQSGTSSENAITPLETRILTGIPGLEGYSVRVRKSLFTIPGFDEGKFTATLDHYSISAEVLDSEG